MQDTCFILFKILGNVETKTYNKSFVINGMNLRTPLNKEIINLLNVTIWVNSHRPGLTCIHHRWTMVNWLPGPRGPFSQTISAWMGWVYHLALEAPQNQEGQRDQVFLVMATYESWFMCPLPTPIKWFHDKSDLVGSRIDINIMSISIIIIIMKDLIFKGDNY